MYGFKSITPSRKLLCAVYVTIAKQDDTFIVVIKDAKAWQGYEAKPWDINRLKHSFFMGSFTTIRLVKEINDHALVKAECLQKEQLRALV
jgi:hypothetical protein